MFSNISPLRRGVERTFILDFQSQSLPEKKLNFLLKHEYQEQDEIQISGNSAVNILKPLDPHPQYTSPPTTPFTDNPLHPQPLNIKPHDPLDPRP